MEQKKTDKRFYIICRNNSFHIGLDKPLNLEMAEWEKEFLDKVSSCGPHTIDETDMTIFDETETISKNALYEFSRKSIESSLSFYCDKHKTYHNVSYEYLLYLIHRNFIVNEKR